MPQATIKKLAGPAYLSNSPANVYNPGTNLQGLVTQINVANVTSSGVVGSVYIGLTGGSAGGTQVIGGQTFPANSVTPFYFNPAVRLATTDFLTGVAASSSSLTILVLGYETAA